MRSGAIISRYLVTTIVPYFLLSWLIVSVIVFVQQAGRYSDLFFNVHIPANLIWQLTAALIPNVVAFTCPMAMLVGTIIGLAKMQDDSELIALRASGVGNFQIAMPIMAVGALMSGFAFIVNLEGVPLAASLVRNVALQTAIKKLESPLEPGAFNTEIAGHTIFVRSGDVETGRWNDVFIYTEDRKNGTLRLITSKRGRIDTAGEASELVLENATVTTLPIENGTSRYISENIGDVRLAVRTTRGEMISRLSRSELTPEELGLQQLNEYAAGREGRERVEAQILHNRRIILSITPFIFSILGTVIVLRINRGGRNFGIAIALAILVGYYLLAFLGEQLARTGTIAPLAGSFIPVLGSGIAIAWFAMSRRYFGTARLSRAFDSFRGRLASARPRLQLRNVFVDLTTGLRDFDIVRNLLKTFGLTLLFLGAIFLIFTAFDLWKFAGTFDGGLWLLAKYLTLLIPFMYLNIGPSAAMIAILATLVIKSRQNEIVTWVAAGQSVYRLLMPCLLTMLLLGGVNWAIQEFILPASNRLQDETRTLIRARGEQPPTTGRNWVASGNRFYSFQLDNSASDNEKRSGDISPRSLAVFELADNGTRVQTMYLANSAEWRNGQVVLTGDATKRELSDGRLVSTAETTFALAEQSNPFTEIRRKPAHLDSRGLAAQISTAESETERRSLEIALQKKWTTLFLPLIMALFTAPFALSMSRKGKAATVGYAVGLWLLFMGAVNVFEQLGLNFYLSPALAVWSPLVIFALLGLYLLSRVRS